MDEETLEKKSYESILYVFEMYLDLNIPMLTRKMVYQDTLDAQKVMENLLANFLLDTNMFGIDVARNPQNANEETLLALYQPRLTLINKENYNVRDPNVREVLQVYLQYLQQLADTLRSYVTSSRFYHLDQVDLENSIGDLLSLEINIASILDDFDPHQEDYDQSYTIMTLDELDTWMNHSGKPNHINLILALKNTLKGIQQEAVTNSTRVLVQNQNYFKQLNGVLNAFPPEDLVNFLMKCEHW